MELVKVIIPIVPLVLKPLKSVAKHVAYPFKVGKNVSSLESETRELMAVKEDVNTTITNAERKNGAPTEQVKLWLDKVQSIEQKAEEIQQNYQQLCRCIWNISPNLWSIYKISRSATKKQIEVKVLRENKPTIDLIVQMPPSLAQEMPASTSKSSYLEQALQAINDDQHNIIGICGMGGVGKTHLLEQINNELPSNDGAFSVVVYVTCSKECSEEKVQKKIIEKLGLDPSYDAEQRQSTIFKFLQNKSFVLLLDDLWSRIELKQIGISDLSDKRKVVLTTRSEEVCNQMEVRKPINVEVLNRDDAWSLFEEKVTKETINSDPLIQKYAKNIVKKLGGLPLALITVGRTMYDERDPRRWEHAVTRLQQARLNEVSEESVFPILSFSYENLKNDTLKQCFLHCALWPEDHLIDKNELVELWMGLGFIDEPEIQSAYNFGYEYIGRLKDVCLLEEAEANGEIGVKLHDVIRDMALWIATNQRVQGSKWIVQAGMYNKSQVVKVSKDTEVLSLMRNYTEQLSLIPSSSTKLSTLLLSYNKLKDVKTLRLESFSELTFLDLSWNIDLETFPIEICKLVQLQFLRLPLLTVKEPLPKDIGALINLKYLLLRGVGSAIPEGVLSKLKALRVLDTRYSLDARNDKFENFSSFEEKLQSLPEFQALGISINNMDDFQKLSQTSSLPVRWLRVHMLNKQTYLSFTSSFLGNYLIQRNLTDIYIFGWGPESVKFERGTDDHKSCCLGRVEKLHFDVMLHMKDVVWKGLNPQDVFPRLQVLIIQRCFELKSISWVVHLPYIRELQVAMCHGMRQLIHMDELNTNAITVSQHSFPSLKKMILDRISMLESISDSMISFPALEYLDVYSCNKLKKLPFKTANPPKKLILRGVEEWWNNLEMDDSSHKSLLQPFFTIIAMDR